MLRNNLLGVTIKNQSKKHILEEINKFLRMPCAFFHVVSLNPENIMISRRDAEYRNILSQAGIQLIDGVGVALGCDILKIAHGERFTGTDFMEKLLSVPFQEGLRILLLGGEGNLAERLAICYQKNTLNNVFKGVEGFKNVRSPQNKEIEDLFEFIAVYKPQVIFAAFGSPWQETFFYANREKLRGILCIGVGGGFDFLSGKITRAPVLMRQIGFEWLFRLMTQPWRWRRQLRLLEYCMAVILQKMSATFSG